MLTLSKTVSIGICSHNDGRTIHRLLLQCHEIISYYNAQNVSSHIKELIVVSSGSTDETNRNILQFSDRINEVVDFKIKIEVERKGKSDAINNIIQLNTSNYLILIPADVQVVYQSIKFLIEKILSDESIGVVSGQPKPILDQVSSSGLRNALKLIWKLHNETLQNMSSLGNNSHSSGELMIIKNGVVFSIPNDIINDDAYIALKAKSEGYIISYEPKAIVKIEVPYTSKDYITQRKRVLIGHKQLSQNTGLQPTNFRKLIKGSPKPALKLLFKSITGFAELYGLFTAFLLEIKIELQIRSEKSLNNRIKKQSNLWLRINQSNVCQD